MSKILLTTNHITKILSPPRYKIYRGRWTRRWRQILYRKQNSPYFCTCTLKKSPNHCENVYW